jgi:hypothetical protein
MVPVKMGKKDMKNPAFFAFFTQRRAELLDTGTRIEENNIVRRSPELHTGCISPDRTEKRLRKPTYKPFPALLGNQVFRTGYL